MWKNYKRRGLFLIWANLAICLVLLLGGAAFWSVGMIAKHVGQAEKESDMLLLAQETMEILKYNHRFGKNLSFPGVTERNGRSYSVEISVESVSVEGVPMKRAVCTVTPEEGEALVLRTLLSETDGE